MRRRLLIALLMSSVAFPALADKRVALVFGQDKYETIRPLENAANDAQAVEEALDKLGFEVSLETNRDLKRMRRALEDFQEDAEGADVALVYFAGHGVEISGENRLLPVDADAASLERLKETSLPLQEVQALLAKLSKVNLVLLDACRNDPFGGAGGESGRGAAALNPTSDKPIEVRPGLGRLGSAENLLYTFSAAPGATAADGAGDNSPFTSALVKYLDTDGLEIRSVMTLVQQEVYDLSRGGQLPYVENGLPQVFFAATQKSDLPERERLLLAMADVSTDLRDEVERLAADKDMPLAPLYGALISSDASALSVEDRLRKLTEAADAFVATREQIRTMASSDPQVATLRTEAEAQLALGAFETARGKLDEAAGIDSQSRDALKANFVERTTSEAATHVISGGASRTNLKYDLAIESYGKAASLYDEVSDQALTDTQRQQQLASYDALGDLYLTVGNLADGRKIIERQLAVATALAEKDPASALWQGDIAAGTLKLARVLSDQGDSSAALEAYERALAIRQKLAAADPGNADALGLEAAAQLQIGSLRNLQGDVDGALQNYAASRAVSERILAQSPDDQRIMETLARTHLLIGEAQTAKKNYREAEASTRASLDLVRKLADGKPDDPSRQALLGDALAQMAATEFDLFWSEKAQDKAAAAIDDFKAAETTLRKLVAADQKNAAYQRSLAGAIEGLANAVRFGARHADIDFDKVEAQHREAIAIREKLAQADPSNKLWVGDLASSYSKFATYFAFVPDDKASIDYTKKAHGAALQLAALDPKNVEWQRTAGGYYAKISESYIQLKDYKAALDSEIAGLEYSIKVAKANPTMPVYFNDVSVMQDRVARIYWMQGDMNNYWAQNDTVLEQARRNVDRFPDNAEALAHLYRAYLKVGETWVKNDPDKALDMFGNSRVNAEKAAALDAQNPDHLYGVYQAEINAAYLIEKKLDRAASRAAYEAAMKTVERLIAARPDEVLYNASKEHVQARLDIVDSGKPPPDYN